MHECNLCSTASTLLIVVHVIGCVTSQQLPNILLIVSDDLGHDDTGFSQQYPQIMTPNIDALVSAPNGLILNEFYTSCVCTPSRASILSGRYTIHTGLNGLLPQHLAMGFPLNLTLLPQYLTNYLHYHCYAVGKWHLGFYKWAHTPTFRGFEVY